MTEEAAECPTRSEGPGEGESRGLGRFAAPRPLEEAEYESEVRSDNSLPKRVFCALLDVTPPVDFGTRGARAPPRVAADEGLLPAPRSPPGAGCARHRRVRATSTRRRSRAALRWAAGPEAAPRPATGRRSARPICRSSHAAQRRRRTERRPAAFGSAGLPAFPDAGCRDYRARISPVRKLWTSVVRCADLCSSAPQWRFSEPPTVGAARRRCQRRIRR